MGSCQSQQFHNLRSLFYIDYVMLFPHDNLCIDLICSQKTLKFLCFFLCAADNLKMIGFLRITDGPCCKKCPSNK